MKPYKNICIVKNMHIYLFCIIDLAMHNVSNAFLAKLFLLYYIYYIPDDLWKMFVPEVLKPNQ